MKKLLVMLIAAALVLSMSMTAFAASYTLSSIASGSSKSSGSAKKTDSDAAVVIPSSHTPITQEVKFYVVDGGGYASTESVYRSNSNRLNEFSLYYTSDKLVVNAYYRLRAKATVTNTTTVTVKGLWEP